MAFQTTSSAISLAKNILSTRTVTEARLETKPTKPAFGGSAIDSPLPRATPESMGISSRHIAEYLQKLEDMPELDMHGVTILREGAVLAEANFGAYDSAVWHISYSECKSVTGLAIGLLVDEGRLSLDDKVLQIFDAPRRRLSSLMLRDLTVRNLLTMSSGVLFNEAGSVTEEDWLNAFFESIPVFMPGERFHYNSMNSYVLSAIVQEQTGESMSEYLRPRLFEPLGIENFHWETCPMGIEKGGWGLYMRREDFAKIGQLILQGGRWDGEQLISEEFISAATTAQIQTPQSYGDYDYGYQIWVGRSRNSFLMSGMFGQNVLGFFDTDLLLVTNAGNDEMFQQSKFFPMTHDFFARDFPNFLPEDAAALRELDSRISDLAYSKSQPQQVLSFLRREPTQPPECEHLDGRRFVVTSENAPSVGLAPLFLQAMQNLYAKGLAAVSFSMRDGQFIVTIEEEDASYDLPLGFYAPERVELNFQGETHLAAVTGRFARDEDDRLCLIMRVSLLETASARHIRFYFAPDAKSMSAAFRETPGVPFLLSGLKDMRGNRKRQPAFVQLLGRGDPDYLEYKIRAAFEPTVDFILKDEDESRA